MDAETLELISAVYQLIVEAGIYRAESIRIAEAAKVIENSQRDINVAFMNELSIIFHRMGIDMKAVLAAASTKWNFLHFTPGLVGGHCIGVDPYYLTYSAEQMGYHSQIILAGRKINDDMGKYVAEHIVKSLIKAQIPVAEAKVAILGYAFKENCPDPRNTRVVDIVSELKTYGISSLIADPVIDKHQAFTESGARIKELEEIREMDAIVITVGHHCFKQLSLKELNEFYQNNHPNQKKVLIDVKGILDKDILESEGYIYWRL
jgi:UDP-N-acetyl-D-galactosamine dehydrogenase